MLFYCFSRGSIERTNSLTICIWCLCIMFCSAFVWGLFFMDWLDKGFIYEESFEMCLCLWWSLIVLSNSVWLTDFKIQLLTFVFSVDVGALDSHHNCHHYHHHHHYCMKCMHLWLIWERALKDPTIITTVVMFFFFSRWKTVQTFCRVFNRERSTENLVMFPV